MARARLLAAWAPASLGVVLAVPSLFLPFGWDTSVHYYVAREWLLRGAVPYRDTFDHKTPGIYVVHAALIAMFGEGMWPIRLAELACVFLLGFVGASLAAPRRKKPSAGAVAAAILGVSLFQFGHLDYWNTAQCELWCVLFASVSWLVVRRTRDSVRACAIAGLFAGAALLMKPVALLLLVMPVIEMVFCGPRRPIVKTVAALGSFAAGSLLLPLAAVFHLWRAGALASAADAVIGANVAYVSQESRAHSMADAARLTVAVLAHGRPTSWAVITTALALVLIAAWRGRRADVRRHALALAFGVLSLAAMIVQLKFYLYHATIMVGAAALVFANAFDELTRLLASFRRQGAAPLVFAAILSVLFLASGSAFHRWTDNAGTTLGWLTGSVNDDLFARRFERTPGKVPFRTFERLGIWLREHTSKDETILVRDEAAEIYVVAERHSDDRFFWSVFLDSPTRNHHRSEWLKEDLDSVVAHPPRYVVVRAAKQRGPSASSYFEALGYEKCLRVEEFQVLSAPRRAAWAIVGGAAVR
jgi:hypothetical protein